MISRQILEILKLLLYYLITKNERIGEVMNGEKELFHIFDVGDTLTFGCYEGKPIQWRVLAKRGGRERLLFAENIVAQQPFHERYISMCWQQCSLRKWLNQKFYREAFSFQEQTQIMNSRLDNLPNPESSVGSGPNTIDKIFVLSLNELDQYVPAEEVRRRNDWWWLRTVGDNNLSACSVYTDGSVYIKGINIHYKEGGVRPAMWIMLRNERKDEKRSNP